MTLPTVILVDTNIMLECHSTGCWRALSGALPLESVEACIQETQTGWADRPEQDRIDEAALRASLRMVHTVDELALAEVALKGGTGLGRGETALWAHALTRDDAWVLCGPDRASMKFGCDNKFKDRLVSLGALADRVGIRPAKPLRPHFMQPWLDNVRTKVILGIL